MCFRVIRKRGEYGTEAKTKWSGKKPDPASWKVALSKIDRGEPSRDFATSDRCSKTTKQIDDKTMLRIHERRRASRNLDRPRWFVKSYMFLFVVFNVFLLEDALAC